MHNQILRDIPEHEISVQSRLDGEYACVLHQLRILHTIEILYRANRRALSPADHHFVKISKHRLIDSDPLSHKKTVGRLFVFPAFSDDSSTGRDQTLPNGWP